MALLLHIDTATEHASVCISRDNELLHELHSPDQKNHASFIQTAINELIGITHVSLKDIDAIAVSAGPGSYTGLRVGMSTAKGLCYALNKPLILVNTLQVIANSAIRYFETKHEPLNSAWLICPMIDARRMEVFTAVYTIDFKEVVAPTAMILDNTSLDTVLQNQKVIFCGNGVHKAADVIKQENAVFIDVQHSAKDLILFAVNSFNLRHFADIAYSEPFYLKEFFSPAPKA